MPKLDNGGFDTKFGYQIDKKNDHVGFEDKTHTYFDLADGSKYISVTQLIHNYTHPFDSDFWSSYKSCEYLLGDKFYDLKQTLLSKKKWDNSYLKQYNINELEFLKKKSEILDSYKEKSKEACEYGSKIHEIMENLFYQKDEKRLKTFGIGGKIEVSKGNYKLDKDRAVYPEILLSYKADEWLKTVGQADLVIKDGNDISIYDWKTSKSIDKESFFDKSTKKRQMMKYPLDNIQESNYWIYSLQLSLYMYMIEKINPKFKCKKLAIIHIDRNGNETEYQCEYLKDDVTRMLLHYHRDQKMKSELDLDKPIVF